MFISYSISYPREFIIREGPFAGADRHNGEIVAFHLARLLSIYRTPLVAGRRILLDDIQRKSSPILNSTFYKERMWPIFTLSLYKFSIIDLIRWS